MQYYRRTGTKRDRTGVRSLLYIAVALDSVLLRQWPIPIGARRPNRVWPQLLLAVPMLPADHGGHVLPLSRIEKAFALMLVAHEKAGPVGSVKMRKGRLLVIPSVPYVMCVLDQDPVQLGAGAVEMQIHGNTAYAQPSGAARRRVFKTGGVNRDLIGLELLRPL